MESRYLSLFVLEVLEKKGLMSRVDLQNELKRNLGEVVFRELDVS